MGVPGLQHTETLRVPFHDCDPLFVVWHGNYYRYFEIARSALLKRLHLDVPHIRAMNYRQYVTETRCRHLAPLTYDDEFVVRATISQKTPVIRVSFRIENVTTGRQAARGYTDLATTDNRGNLITPTPDEIIKRLNDAENPK